MWFDMVLTSVSHHGQPDDSSQGPQMLVFMFPSVLTLLVM